MSFIAAIKENRWIRALIVAKTFLIVGLWLSIDTIRIGDKPLVAQERAGVGPAATPVPTASPEQAGPPRRSFLDQLLNLPDLDPDSVKREEISRFLSLADRKKKQVDERVAMMARRETQLLAIEKSIDDKLVKLEEERKFFTQTIQRERELKGQRLERIVELYDKMEPKKAAPVIEELDRDLVVQLFRRLRQKQVTAILEAMSPEKSVELSEYFGRVRSGREYDLLKEMNRSLRKEFNECRGMPADETAALEDELPVAAAAPANPAPVAAASGPVTAGLAIPSSATSASSPTAPGEALPASAPAAQ